MICPNCGKEIDDNAKICPYCKHDLAADNITTSKSGEAADEKKGGLTKSQKTQGLILLAVCIAAIVLCQLFHLK